MKLLCVLSTVLIWPSFHGCDGVMLFTEPQPLGGDTLATIPSEWLGCYRQEDDSAYVEVTADGFTVTGSGRVPMGENELLPDTADDPVWARLKVRFMEGLRDTVVVLDEQTYHFRFNAEQHAMLYDEIGRPQRIGREFSLRRSGGRLCLTVPIDTLSPTAYQVDVWERRGTGFLWRVVLQDKLDAINRVVDLPGDTLAGPVAVTRKQFEGLLRKGAYAESAVMVPCAWCASTIFKK